MVKKLVLTFLLTILFMVGSAFGNVAENSNVSQQTKAGVIDSHVDLATKAIKCLLTGNYEMLLTVADPTNESVIRQYRNLVNSMKRRGVKPQSLSDGVKFKINDVKDVGTDKVQVNMAVDDGKGNIGNVIVNLVKRNGKWYFSNLKDVK